MLFHRSVVLFSGGLTSTVALAKAVRESEAITALGVFYGQRHAIELGQASKIVSWFGEVHTTQGKQPKVTYQEVEIRMDMWTMRNSAVTGGLEDIPKRRAFDEIATQPSKLYVPGRNLVFLAIALSMAEALGAECIYHGLNMPESSRMPDADQDFLQVVQTLSHHATEAGQNGMPITIQSPCLTKTKAEIVRLGRTLMAPLHLTWSCCDPQQGNGQMVPCTKCDACKLRERGFNEIAVDDPALVAYKS